MPLLETARKYAFAATAEIAALLAHWLLALYELLRWRAHELTATANFNFNFNVHFNFTLQLPPPLNYNPQVDQPGDTKLLLAELSSLADPRLAFLKGHIDLARLGITGHSAGGFATGTLSKGRSPSCPPDATVRCACCYGCSVAGSVHSAASRRAARGLQVSK